MSVLADATGIISFCKHLLFVEFQWTRTFQDVIQDVKMNEPTRREMLNRCHVKDAGIQLRVFTLRFWSGSA